MNHHNVIKKTGNGILPLLVFSLMLSAFQLPLPVGQEPEPTPTNTIPMVVESPAQEPTAEPPTEIPPTEVPPTEIPPTEIPPTEVPPTEIPPTEVPPTEPPTESPPTAETIPSATPVVESTGTSTPEPGLTGTPTGTLTLTPTVSTTPTPSLSPTPGEGPGYFSINSVNINGLNLDEMIIVGPPVPPPGTEGDRQPVAISADAYSESLKILDIPAYTWVYGCSAVTGAMIAGQYDRNGFPNMYTGPTNGGVMPMTNSSWGTWSDGYSTYPANPLIASKNGVDGRGSNGSIDNYWVKYNSTANDPFITNGWTEHSYGTAIGDYMRTSQSSYSNVDGSTTFYNWTSSSSPLTCTTMDSYGLPDGTRGRRDFYQARGYTVTDCYNQRTDNQISGGFTFAQYKAEIDAGHPVMINLAGHTVAGVGYDDSTNTVFIHDTWDTADHSFTWGGSYSGMVLQSVSIVHLSQNYVTLTLSGTTGGSISANPTNSPGLAVGQYLPGTSVVLTATPEENALFLGWTGSISGTTNPVTITLNSNMTIGATFSSNELDDTSPAISYSGSWSTYTSPEPYNGTLHYTWTPGSQASLTFYGAQISYIYTGYNNRGNVRIAVDGSDVALINAYSAAPLWQQEWVSPILSTGYHTITITAVSGYVDLDAFFVRQEGSLIYPTATTTATATATLTRTPTSTSTSTLTNTSTITSTATQTPTISRTPTITNTVAMTPVGPVVGTGTEDDRSSNLVYTGAWYDYNATGPYNGTLRYSYTPGSKVSLSFNGNRVTYVYTTYSNRGQARIQIDGVELAVINAYSPSMNWQQSWTSPELATGMHTITVTLLSGWGDLDAFVVEQTGPTGTPTISPTVTQTGTTTQTPTISLTPTITNTVAMTPVGPVVGTGTEDDRSPNLVYTGAWYDYNATGPYSGTLRYSYTPGSKVSLSFNGNRVTYVYTTYSNRGQARIQIDGVELAVINAYSPSMNWQQSWTSPELATGMHTITVTLLSGWGDLDAFVVEQTGPAGTPTITPTATRTPTITNTLAMTPVGPVVGAGTVDDQSTNIIYTGAWYNYPATGPYNGTLRFSYTAGSRLAMSFNGTRITYVFTKYSNRGWLVINIDGVNVETISQYSPTLDWQQSWTSPVLSSGVHNITVTLLNGYGDLDAFIVE